LLLAAKQAGGNVNNPAYGIWASILGVTPNSSEHVRLIAEHNLKIIDLRRVVEDDKKMRSDVKSDYLATIELVQSCLQPNILASAWQNTQNSLLNDNVIKRMCFLDHALEDRYPENSLGKSVVNEIKADLDQILNELVDCNISDELRRLIRTSVESLRRVIWHYKIYGNKNLEKVLERAIG
jgi:hypothetical protein